MVSLTEFLSVVRHPFQWYERHTQQMEQEARQENIDYLEEHIIREGGIIDDIEQLMHGGSEGYAIQALVEWEKRNAPSSPYENDQLRRSILQGAKSVASRVDNNERFFRQRAGDRLTDEFLQTHARLLATMEAYEEHLLCQHE